ncbi:MAG: hypothetical protein C0504_18110 [Candidatus Solibacter sp.]|nr:hypothetical protein [Candidatus Solibacter sp.]
MTAAGTRQDDRPGGVQSPAADSTCLGRALQALAEAEDAVSAGSAAGLFEAAGHLEAAVEACRQYTADAAGLQPGDRALDADRLIVIRTGLQRIGSLMAQSAEFHAGWARLAGLRASAYGPDGSELGLPAGSAAGSRCDASG